MTQHDVVVFDGSTGTIKTNAGWKVVYLDDKIHITYDTVAGWKVVYLDDKIHITYDTNAVRYADRVELLIPRDPAANGDAR